MRSLHIPKRVALQFNCCGLRNNTDFMVFSPKWERNVTCYDETIPIMVSGMRIRHCEGLVGTTIIELSYFATNIANNKNQ